MSTVKGVNLSTAFFIFSVFIINISISAKCCYPASSQELKTISKTQLENPRLCDQTFKSRVETDKLKAETDKLKAETDKLNSFRRDELPNIATFITTLVALFGIYFTAQKQIADNRANQEQKDINKQHEIDESFRLITSNFGSDKAEVKAGAIVSILTFLDRKYERLHEQVYMIILVNLKIDSHPLSVKRLLVKGFEQALRVHLSSIKERDKRLKLDLSNTYLCNTDLSDLELNLAVLDEANLENANLTNTKMEKAKLYRIQGKGIKLERTDFTRACLKEAKLDKAKIVKTTFAEADMVSANLKTDKIENAIFNKASLQEARFEGVVFENCHFENANLNNTFFWGARLDDATQKSIIKALNWRQAKFDRETRNVLAQLARNIP